MYNILRLWCGVHGYLTSCCKLKFATAKHDLCLLTRSSMSHNVWYWLQLKESSTGELKGAARKPSAHMDQLAEWAEQDKGKLEGKIETDLDNLFRGAMKGEGMTDLWPLICRERRASGRGKIWRRGP